ncbi:MAG: translation elongation factor Ts [Desulfovibrio sp.]|jgi:elongation factor Ts|nr:translation elongation factor Ts [Desulfovibrio sp.]
MAEISAALVKELRERTGAGMMDCKKALQESGGSLEEAVDFLRRKGLSKAAKKAGRVTSEGVIGVKSAPDRSAAALVEVLCETDFVARGEHFKAFAAAAADKVFANRPADADALAALTGDDLHGLIATLGENMSVGRFVFYEAAQPGIVESYVHSNGKIGVLVEVGTGTAAARDSAELLELAHNLAMQAAATGAVALDKAGLDPALLERERAIYRQKTLDEGKPDNIVEKIVEGGIQKFCKEVCLLEQAYIRDDKVTVKSLVDACAATLKDTVTVRRFTRLRLGEHG